MIKKLKVHRANSQTIPSYSVTFSTDILFTSLVSFTFSIVVVFLLKIYILIHIRLCGRVSDIKNFTRPISGNKTTFLLNIINASWETKKERLSQKKVNRRICVRDITFLIARPPFHIICVFFFLCLLPLLSQVTYLQNGPYKDI